MEILLFRPRSMSQSLIFTGIKEIVYSIINLSSITLRENQDSESTEFTIRSNYLKISKGYFTYHDQNISDTIRRMNYNHIKIDGLNLEAEDIYWSGKSVKAKHRIS